LWGTDEEQNTPRGGKKSDQAYSPAVKKLIEETSGWDGSRGVNDRRSSRGEGRGTQERVLGGKGPSVFGKTN